MMINKMRTLSFQVEEWLNNNKHNKGLTIGENKSSAGIRYWHYNKNYNSWETNEALVPR